MKKKTCCTSRPKREENKIKALSLSLYLSECCLERSFFLFVRAYFVCVISATVMDLMADLNAPHSMGTTIIGVTYDGGVVLGADSRTSTGTASSRSHPFFFINFFLFLSENHSFFFFCPHKFMRSL